METAKNTKVGMFGGPILTPDRRHISSAGHALRGKDGAFLDVDWNKDLSTSDRCRFSEKGYEPFAPCFAAALWSVSIMEEVDLPDNDQPIYYDDVDLAYKARLKKWFARFVEAAKAVHPLPRRQTDDTRLKAQTRRHLATVARYFPDHERQMIFDSVSKTALQEDCRLFMLASWETMKSAPEYLQSGQIAISID